MNKLLQKSFSLVFHIDSTKTQNCMCDDKLKSLCTQQKHFHDQSIVLKQNIFQHHREKLLLVGNLTRKIWVWRMKIFLMKINVNECTLDNFLHIVSSYNVSILTFQKMIKKYNKSFHKMIYTLTSEMWQKFVYDLQVISFLKSFVWISAKYFQPKST